MRRFQEARAGVKGKLRGGQFKCLGCKSRVFPEVSSVSIVERARGGVLASAACPDCCAVVFKLLGETECYSVRKCLDTNTSLTSIDEDRVSARAGIGKDQRGVGGVVTYVNDRMIHAWQGYAERYHPKTVTAHLTSIREFEGFLAGKSIARLTQDDIIAWRKKLIANDERLGTSTIRHRASQVSGFLKWLADQPGHSKLRGLSDYCGLPKRLKQAALPEQKRFPKLDEAVAMLDAMPSKSLSERRMRAIFAFAFLTGLRADALITVRLKHVKGDERRVIHDGSEMRTKNGKSFIVNWFPRTAPFEAVVLEWLSEVTALGLGADDALFPEMKGLETAPRPVRSAIPPMKTAGAVTEAFKRACEGRKISYSPHSARHTLVNLGDQLCRTAEERKAWSLNLGHATEAVTWEHYGKVDGDRKDEIFESFDAEAPATSGEVELMLRYHEHELIRGTPEFEQAERLVDERRRSRQRRTA